MAMNLDNCHFYHHPLMYVDSGTHVYFDSKFITLQVSSESFKLLS